MATLTLDVVIHNGETFDQVLGELVDGLGLDAGATGLVMGGGYPEVRFTGERSALVALVHRYLEEPEGSDDEEVFWHVGRIED